MKSWQKDFYQQLQDNGVEPSGIGKETLSDAEVNAVAGGGLEMIYEESFTRTNADGSISFTRTQAGPR